MRAAFLVALVLAAAPPAGAVLVRVPAAETGPGLPGPALTHLAVVAGLSGMYLGDGWLLTAGHVVQAARNQKKTGVVIGGRAFVLRTDTAKTVQSGQERTDLAVVRIEGDPGLPSLEIAHRAAAVGTEVVLAGNGPLQEAQRGCWNTSGQPVRSAGPGILCGYAWRKTPEGKTNGVEWGTNQVASVGEAIPGPGGARTRGFATQFRDDGASAREAQAGVGDSGGPVLAREGEGYVLVGVMLGVAARSGSAALFGDRTLVADLSHYRAEILRLVGRQAAPEAGGDGAQGRAR